MVAATRLNDTYIECLSPNISAYFNDATDVYKDVFISVNDADGVFRLQQQLAFTYIKDYALTGVDPPSMYINQ